MAKKNGKEKSVLDIPVEFGGVSIGQITARIGVRFSRSSLNINAADEAFCGHRLTGKVQLGNHDDSPGQGKLIEDLEHELAGSFDCKRIGITTDSVTTGLTFSLSDIDVAELAKFSKGSGRLIVEHVAELPEDAPAENDEDKEDKKHVPGSLTVDGDPKRTLMSKIFKGKILKALEGAGINDVERLGNYTEGGKKLGDIDGIGPGNAVIIGETMVSYWNDNRPQGFEIHNKKK